jgi:hypothetical protein
MWLMTTEGFYSVSRWNRPDQFDGMLCVRARERPHLERLLSRLEEDVRHNPDGRVTGIAVTPDGDYRYRAWVDDVTLGVTLAGLAGELDYPNFKDAVFRRQGETLYERALHKVWGIMAGLQPGGPYGVGGSYPPVPKGEPKRRRPKAVRDLF